MLHYVSKLVGVSATRNTSERGGGMLFRGTSLSTIAPCDRDGSSSGALSWVGVCFPSLGVWKAPLDEPSGCLGLKVNVVADIVPMSNGSLASSDAVALVPKLHGIVGVVSIPGDELLCDFVALFPNNKLPVEIDEEVALNGVLPVNFDIALVSNNEPLADCA